MSPKIRRFVRREHAAPASFKATIGRALFKPVQIMLPLFLSFAFVSFLVAQGVVPSIAITPKPEHSQTQDLAIETPESRAAALVEENGCWNGPAPVDMEGKMPGHVVTQKGLGGPRMVAKALDQIFNDTQHGITVYGFCR